MDLEGWFILFCLNFEGAYQEEQGEEIVGGYIYGGLCWD